MHSNNAIFHPSGRMLPHVSSTESAHCLMVKCYYDVLLLGREAKLERAKKLVTSRAAIKSKVGTWHPTTHESFRSWDVIPTIPYLV